DNCEGEDIDTPGLKALIRAAVGHNVSVRKAAPTRRGGRCFHERAETFARSRSRKPGNRGPTCVARDGHPYRAGERVCAAIGASGGCEVPDQRVPTGELVDRASRG